MTSHPVTILLLGLMIALLGAAFAWGLSRRYRRALGLEKEDHKKTEDVGFVINAFHEVTKQLKEKEKELERLKALAEKRAENVESYNENILQCVTNGVITFGANGVVMTFNRAAEEMLGIQKGQAAGKQCIEILNDKGICRVIRETLERRQPSVRMEAALERPSGKIWLGYNTALLTDNAGAALGVIFSFSDLTEVKRLQEQVELRERLTALGEMSAGIAHELRNPMGVISGYLNILSKKSDPSGQAIIRNISAEINGMNRIIGDLLTFARPASLNRVRVNIKEMLESSLAVVLQAKGDVPHIMTAVDADDIEAQFDEGLIKQALCNLIQNAVEAMPEGGSLSLGVLGRNKDILIAVKDTGVGIPADRLNKIFLPFFTTKDKGTGLGLALAHKIILSHGGRIEAESSEGKGTTFTVILPR